MSNGTKTQRVRTILDDIKLRLTAEPVGNSRKRPSLSVTARGRDLYFECTTNVDGDTDDYGKIGVAMEVTEGYIVLDRILHYANPATPAGSEATVVSTQFAFGKRHDKPVVIGKVAVGKNEDGVVWISVLAFKDTRPKIKFFFGDRFLYKHVRADKPFAAGDISQFCAASWVNLLKTFMPIALPGQFKIAQEKDDKYWAERKAKEAGNGGGNNSYSSGGDGYSGGNSNSGGDNTGDDDGLPF